MNSIRADQKETGSHSGTLAFRLALKAIADCLEKFSTYAEKTLVV